MCWMWFTLMINKQEQLRSRAWEVSTLIKLVATKDTQAICKIARELKNKYADDEEMDKIPDITLYERYCDYTGTEGE